MDLNRYPHISNTNLSSKIEFTAAENNQRYDQHHAHKTDGSGRPFKLKSDVNTTIQLCTEEDTVMMKSEVSSAPPSPIVSNNRTQIRGQHVSPRGQQNETYRDLSNSVHQKRINIFEAGQAVHNGYGRNDSTVHEQVSRFVDYYAGKIVGSDMPLPSPVLHPHYLFIMTHGYGIVSQLALAATQSQRPKTEQDSMDLGTLTGAIVNIDESVPFHYPQEPPFSGGKIDFRCEMPRQKNEPPHVLIKKLLFTLLSRSCTVPTDIQTIVWSIPDDCAAPRSINPRPFPRILYDNLQTLIAQYFRIDEDLLSRGTYDAESCKNLKCLQGIVDHTARKNRYLILHKARTKFLSFTFHLQFKAALVDLKRSTYLPPPPGQTFGFFKLKSHASKRHTAHEDESNQSSSSHQ